MDATIFGSLIGIGFLMVVNIGMIAYSYGKISQKVTDLCERVSRLERLVNSKRGG